jgi:hypothetical protein
MPTSVARIGRSYPRPHPQAADGTGAPRARLRWRFTIAGGVIALASALALAGWLIFR